MKLTFIGHSSYLIDTGDRYILFDYYRDSVDAPSLGEILPRPGDPLYIFCTHSHGDHFSRKVFDLPVGDRPIRYIFHSEVADAVPKKQSAQVLFVDTEESFSVDKHICGRAYGSTDLGGSFYVEIKVPNDRPSFTLFHAGDLNNWHWNEEANDYYINLYETAYREELERFGRHPIAPELLMFPTDYRLGKDYLKGLKQFLEIAPCRYLAPMHLNGKPKHAPELSALCDKYNIRLLFPEREGITFDIE
ncbi:MBL fold metallo-hydrolase [Porphyromonas sp.]|uniref:MBL fold metallo-hydrolase n=1 Tax=Porphyromonas sp. TaxID=1924944 RepID=UPI0026DC7C50|nr:MBL fold metallo-hydrolase [Porphyromonas sp.]MDO4771845.1 MBL fold metallo-hydrolase [Porphyromonas sp.]